MSNYMVGSVVMPIKDIKPYPYNTKTHSFPQIRRIANSISKYGWDQAIVVDEKMVIIKGHGRYLAAEYLNLTEVPVIINNSISDEDVMIARIADNKCAESDWDFDILWSEMSLLRDSGISFKDMAFTNSQLKRLFPDKEEFDTKNDIIRDSKKEDSGVNLGTEPEQEGFIKAHKGEDEWLRSLSIIDYLSYHDKIVVMFSSGKDSIATLLWVLENCDRNKVVVIYANPGWGVDWPHSIALIPIIEKQLGIKILMAGDSDPSCRGGFEQNLIQAGYPGLGVQCWIEGWVKIPRVDSLMRQEGLLSRESGVRVVQVLGIRWEESPHRAKIYPDRGVFKDNGNHYCSVVLKWTTADIINYIVDRGYKLHTAYQIGEKLGCLLCPKTVTTGKITLRKRCPNHWMRILEYQAISARSKGKLPPTFCKWLCGIDDVRDQSKFMSSLGGITYNTDEVENLLSESMGEEVPRPFLSELYDPRTHKFRNDLKKLVIKPWTWKEDTGGCFT